MILDTINKRRFMLPSTTRDGLSMPWFSLVLCDHGGPVRSRHHRSVLVGDDPILSSSMSLNTAPLTGLRISKGLGR